MLPVEKCGLSGSPGPEDEVRRGQVALRTQGFLALAFGLASGVTVVVVFYLLRMLGVPTASLRSLVMRDHPNLWLGFLYGFIGGTLLAGVYNLLVVHELHHFGLESDQD